MVRWIAIALLALALAAGFYLAYRNLEDERAFRERLVRELTARLETSDASSVDPTESLARIEARMDRLLRIEEELPGLREEKDGLADRIRTLEVDLERTRDEALRLGEEAETARAETKRTKDELKKQIIVLARERNKLDAGNRLLDEAMARLNDRERALQERLDSGSEASSGDGSAETLPPAGKSSDDSEATRDSGEIEGSHDPEGVAALTVGNILVPLNRLLNAYLDEEFRIVESRALKDRRLMAPVIATESFLNAGEAVLLPDRLEFRSLGDELVIAAWGGSFRRPDGQEGTISNSGLELVRFRPEEGEALLTPRLERLFGYGAYRPETLFGEGEEGVAERVRRKLNDLLVKERAGQYRFDAIETVSGKNLISVVLEIRSPEGNVEKRVEADSCRIRLVKRDRYLEMDFQQGFVQVGEDRKPFYKNRFRLPIPRIDPELWIGSDLSLIEVEAE